MKKKSRAFIMVIAALLIATTSVFVTIAYLTDTDSVKNTFTVGNVDILLDEADVNPDGTYVTDHDTRVQENEYHLLPGHTYLKDPTVTVLANSEDSYVRTIVTVERIDQLKLAMPADDYPDYYINDIFLLEKLVAGWDPATWVIQGYTTDSTNGIYEFRYKEIVPKSGTDTVLDDLFESFTIPGTIDNTHLAYLKDVVIDVDAHAIQADGFANAAAAWDAFGTP
jgi:predicted ribosomally synthesized peptide with SipW-like signal peptide